jgi:hypothetical protein
MLVFIISLWQFVISLVPADAHTYAHAGQGATVPSRTAGKPAHSQLFDTVFGMGVLYRRQSPFRHL